MKKLSLLVAIVFCLFACQKNHLFNAAATRNPFTSRVQAFLADSLPGQTFDFDHLQITTPDSGRTQFFKVPIAETSHSWKFYLVRVDSNGHLQGLLVNLAQNQTDSDTGRAPFNGNIQQNYLNGTLVYNSTVVDGVISSLHPMHNSHVAVNAVTTLSDFDGTGEDLPEIVITAPTAGASSGTYADFSAIYAGPSGGVTHSGGSSASYSLISGGIIASLPNPTLTLNVETIQPGIDIKGFMDCLGLISGAGTNYSVSLVVALPDPSDPSVLFNVATRMVGHTFLQLTVSNNGYSITQFVGFDPSSAAWSFIGSMNIASAVVDNGGHLFNALYTISVNDAQFFNVVNTVIANADKPYNLFGYNCTNYALAAFNAAGGTQVNPAPSDIPGTFGTQALTPNGVYQTLQQMQANGQLNGSLFTSQLNQTAGQSHGSCD